MDAEIEEKIQRAVPLIKNKINILHFSTGADSIACFFRLREMGIEPILIYNYFLPNIPMVDNYIDYFEKTFNTKVYKLPSKLYCEHTDNALYQLPIKARETFRNHITEFGLWKDNPKKQRKQIISALNKKPDEIIFSRGLKYTDGFFRRYNIKTYGAISKDNTFCPIGSFTPTDVINIIKKYNCKLPIEYKLWGISLEAPRSWNIGFIRQNCPVSYDYICEYFPMMKLLEYRDKYNKLNQHFKIRLAQFADYAMDKSGYEVW